MTDLLTSLAQEWGARRPWLDPPDHSVWLASRTYPRGRGTFTDCLVVAVPQYTSGGPLFRLFPPINDLIDRAWIERAQRMVLVYADDPGRPWADGDLPYLTAPSRVRASRSEQQAETITPAGLSGCPRHQADRQPRTAKPRDATAM